MPGIPCPLAGRKPGDIDYYVVRENTEGEYSSVGGRMFAGTDREFVTQQACFTRKGVDRIMKFAFELAMTRPRKQVTSATKSNGIAPSANMNPERAFPSLFAPVHGSAPDIYGKAIAAAV